VIPAHNEEATIAQAIRSCAELDYPQDRRQVFVVADNCSDATARLARENGAVCLERTDPTCPGKGHALAWALEQIVPEEHDAILVLDADCRIERHALRVFDQHLAAGAKVLQANDVAANPDASVTSYAVAVGNLIENQLFYAPKSHLGLAVFLRGTGMVFHRDILRRHPWHTHSLVEDTEFTLQLLRAGTRVRFVGNVQVASAFPTTAAELTAQRTRWATGNIRLGKTQAFRLIGEGLRQGRGLLLDAGWTLLVLSRPLVLLQLALAVLLGCCCVWLEPGSISTSLCLTGWVLVGMQGMYFGLGIVRLGLDRGRLALLLGAPVVVLRLLQVALVGSLRTERLVWTRTLRPGPGPR
jgi:hypothetical protein